MQEVAKRAVLVSVANFEPGVSLGARHGAKEDTRRLHRVLSKLDFQVDIHQDLNSHEIYRLFRKVPCDHLHQSNVTTCVLGADGAPVWLSRVFAYFDRADVERMAKVFLIQACHGDATVDSCGERESTDTVDSRQRGRHVRHRRRWLDYQAVGKRLHGTRFVAFKVPLNQSLNRQLMPSQTFGPWELLDAIRRDGQELGLVVDLTFTTRYYRPQDLPVSLGYVKVLTKGHVVPADNAIFAFKRAVRRFLRDNGDNDKLIGVHCTHGLNRTGYMICRCVRARHTRAWPAHIYCACVCACQVPDRCGWDGSRGGHQINEGMDNECLPPSTQGRAHPRRANGRLPEDGRWSGAYGSFPPGAESRRPPEWPDYEGPRHHWPPHIHPSKYPPQYEHHHPNQPPHNRPQYERPQRGQPPLLGSLLPSPPTQPPAHLYGQALSRAASQLVRPRNVRPPPSPALTRYSPRWGNQQRGEDEGWG
ncbi:uncharacterized protein LOC133489907 isoform X3 [Phyllopteryx taeniolatus]|uniref:uncharacterized protein LOC133489907 isoform X3 n=1 Tax=Phyllopteryx taeniolatus TaxID=161469 RepID=UPI002AD43F39|nr:uncharacterized protein LOC133489907 isoform X3 [Phyllopteryx taeniolatus]